MIQKYLQKPGKSKYLGVVIKPEDIKDELIYPFEYKNIHTSIVFYLTDYTIFNNSIVEKTKQYIKHFIDYIQPLKPKRKMLNVLIIPTNKTKQFPKGLCFKYKHVNNAFTTTYLSTDTKEILIYRHEDMYKVLIHELIHYFDIDLKGEYMVHDSADYYLLDKIKDTTHFVNMNEAYTETLASYLYIKFTYPQKDAFKKAMNMQRIRFIKIMNAIIQHAESKRNKKIEQTTHMYEYYICRAILFDNISKFMFIVQSKNLKNDTTYVVNMMGDILSKKNMYCKKYNAYTPLESLRSTISTM